MKAGSGIWLNSGMGYVCNTLLTGAKSTTDRAMTGAFGSSLAWQRGSPWSMLSQAGYISVIEFIEYHGIDVGNFLTSLM